MPSNGYFVSFGINHSVHAKTHFVWGNLIFTIIKKPCVLIYPSVVVHFSPQHNIWKGKKSQFLSRHCRRLPQPFLILLSASHYRINICPTTHSFLNFFFFLDFFCEKKEGWIESNATWYFPIRLDLIHLPCNVERPVIARLHVVTVLRFFSPLTEMRACVRACWEQSVHTASISRRRRGNNHSDGDVGSNTRLVDPVSIRKKKNVRTQAADSVITYRGVWIVIFVNTERNILHFTSSGWTKCSIPVMCTRR